MKKMLMLALALLLLAGLPAAGAESAGDAGVAEMIAFAIQDEVNAEAAYQAILDTYGAQARPFANIVRAERAHQAWLQPLMDAYGIALPQAETMDMPATFAEALQLGVQAEEANIAIYQGFLDQGGLSAEVAVVFERLMAASGNHLNAFSRGGGMARAGQGFQGGRGRGNQAPASNPGLPGCRRFTNP